MSDVPNKKDWEVQSEIIYNLSVLVEILTLRVEALEAKPKRSSGMQKPTLEEVKSYFDSKCRGNDALDFFEFYESKGWMVGKNPMKKWELAANKWIRSNNNDTFNNKPTGSTNQIRPEQGKYGNLPNVQG